MRELDVRKWLETLEASAGDTEAVAAPLAFAAGQAVGLDAAELNAARRRALFVLAAGGDLQRALDPDARAVVGLAADLGTTARRDALTQALRALAAHAADLPVLSAALDSLLQDGELAWRWFCLALLADEMGDE